MDLTRIAPTDRQHIQKYSPNGFVVSGVVFTGPILVFSQESLSWNAEASEFLKPEDLTPILERARTLDLCLLGCGNRMTPVALATAGVGVVFWIAHKFSWPKLILKALGFLVVSAAVGATAMTFVVGHSGAEAVWG